MTATDQRKLVLQGQSTSSVLSVAIEIGAVRGVQLSAHLSFPCRNPQRGPTESDTTGPAGARCVARV